MTWFIRFFYHDDGVTSCTPHLGQNTGKMGLLRAMRKSTYPFNSSRLKVSAVAQLIRDSGPEMVQQPRDTVPTLAFDSGDESPRRRPRGMSEPKSMPLTFTTTHDARNLTQPH